MKKKMTIKTKRFILNAFIITGLVLGLAACDNELNTLGSDILGADQLSDRIKKQEFDVVAFNELIGPIQSNNFNSMLIGSYNDPVYGRSDYGFVSQLSLSNSNPSFGINPVLDSVVLNVPYYSTVTEINGDDRGYRIDSLYGSSSFHLQVYQNNFFLSDIDPLNIEETATYYSDLGATIDAQKGALIYEDINFFPSNDEIILTQTDEDTNEVTVLDRLAPTLRVPLENDFWEDLIVGQEGTSNLQSNSNFQNFFRGLYFKVNSINGEGSFTHLNLNGATVDLFLKISIQDISDFDNDGDTTELNVVDSKFTLTFGRNAVSLIDNSQLDPTVVSTILAANDDINGEERLYLKGGPGSMVLLDLFGPDADMNGEADALTEVIANDWLINEASLVFYVDQNAVQAGETEPERIVIYNFDDNAILADFVINPEGIALNSNVSHLGRLEREESGDENSQGVRYKIRLTRHINNIINGNAENVRLALSVSQNVNSISTSDVKTPNLVEEILTGSAISHEGTILHGNLSSDLEKRLKLEVFYTESN